MKLTPNQKHNLRELQKLVAAVHGPHATVTPLWKVVVIRFGVQWESPPWGELTFTLRRCRESVHKAATADTFRGRRGAPRKRARSPGCVPRRQNGSRDAG